MRRDIAMQQVYDALRSDCFNGALPPLSIFSVTSEEIVAQGRPLLKGLYLPSVGISVCADFFPDSTDATQRRELEQLLLHEACHHVAGMHDDEFQAELRRLATVARCAWVAPWVEEEVARCVAQTERETLMFRAVRECQDLKRTHGALPWPAARRLLAARLGIRPPEVNQMLREVGIRSFATYWKERTR